MENFFTPEKIISYASIIAVVIFCMPVHEYAHARVAVAFGDDTPYKSGRLSLNPLAHLDLFGTLALFFFGIGWAKPVTINISNFKHRRLGRICTSLAGPLANIVLSFIFVTVYHIFNFVGNFGPEALTIVYSIAFLNTSLAVLNLLPFLPFDGGNIFAAFLPNKVYYKVYGFFRKYQTAIGIIMFVVFYFGIFSIPLHYISMSVFSFLSKLSLNLVNLFVS